MILARERLGRCDRNRTPALWRRRQRPVAETILGAPDLFPTRQVLVRQRNAAPWRRGGAAAALATAAVLGACRTVGPDYRGPPPNSEFRNPEASGAFVSGTGPAFSSESAPGRWWRLYDDPRLDRLVEEAFAANTDLRAAEANLEKSRALLREARAGRQPNIQLNVNPSYQQLSTESYLQPGVIAPLGLIDLGVTVTYELDLFGRIHRAIQAAAADDEAVRAARDLARVTVAAEVARAFADVCGAGEQLAAAERVLALQRESGALTLRLVRAGKGTALDLTRVNAQLSQLQADVPALEAQRQNALFRLATLTGRPPAEFPRDLSSCAVAPRLTTPIPIGDGAALLRRRPDVREAERRLAAATDRIGVSTGALYPVVKLGASAGSTGALTDVLTPPTDRYAIGPDVVWQANQNASRARIAAAEADARLSLARFDGVVLTALREVETALTTYGHDLDRNRDLQRVLAQARTALQQSTRLYRAGRTDALNLLDAQRTLANAERVLAASDGQLSSDQISIFMALGGGWEEAARTRPTGKTDQRRTTTP